MGEDCPDLVVSSIDAIDVDCPGGGGTCVTTVTFTIENVGGSAAGAFDVRGVMDPGAGVTVTQPVAGLAAGASMSVTITSPPGGNCFDPDCSVCITADSGGAVTESNETNNETCDLRIG
jgi:subtilase family serine protease